MCLFSPKYRNKREKIASLVDAVYGNEESFEVDVNVVQGINKKTLFNRF